MTSEPDVVDRATVPLNRALEVECR